MADTTSIASRMEKLAQLKRMKEGLAKGTAATPASAAAELEAATSATEAFESFPAVEPDFPAEPELSIPEDVLQAPTVADDQGPSDDPSDFDPASVWEEESSTETSVAEDEDSAPDQETTPETTATTDDGDVNFIMKSSEPSIQDEVETAEFDRFDDEAPSAQMSDDENTSAKGLSASALGIDDEAFADFDEIAAIAGTGGVAAAAATSMTAGSTDDEPADSSEDTQIPDFSDSEVEAELLEREFENEALAELPSTKKQETATGAAAPAADENPEGRISISFDESRSTLLNHVSRQMGCSVDDVVVTALDWYLDALFGEDEEAKSA